MALFALSHVHRKRMVACHFVTVNFGSRYNTNTAVLLINNTAESISQHNVSLTIFTEVAISHAPLR